MNFLETVYAAGIVGEGGAGFPTHVKLKTEAPCFIINAAECEPLIETDKYLCRTFPEELISGALVVAEQLKAERIVIALKGKYKKEIACLKQAIAKLQAPVELFEMKTFYPAGDEQTMVQEVLGKSIPEGGLPGNVGAVVDNVGTVIDIWQGLQGKKVTHKYLSVVGEVPEPVMLQVPIGTPITDCIRWAHGKLKETAIIIGGPMMGKILSTEDEITEAVVTKTTGNIIVLPKDHYLVKRDQMPLERMKKQARTACIQCHMCTDLCPRYLIGHDVRPHIVMRNVFKETLLAEDEESYVRAFGSAVNCCDCGICEMFACPMELSPRKMNIYFKAELRKKGITVKRNQSPQPVAMIAFHKTPTNRLVARLGLSQYDGKHVQTCYARCPEAVRIPLKMHIGAPAKAVVSVGDLVKEGDLMAMAVEGLSANVHCSVTGRVTKVLKDAVEISVEEGLSL